MLAKPPFETPTESGTAEGAGELAQTTWSFLDDRTACEDCWMGEYKETGYRYCGNNKCPVMPGAGN